MMMIKGQGFIFFSPPLPPLWDVSSSQVYHEHYIHQYHLKHKSGGTIVSCLALYIMCQWPHLQLKPGLLNPIIRPSYLSLPMKWECWTALLFCCLWNCCTAVVIAQTVKFTSSLFSARMDYLECNFGPSCTCDHRSPFHGTAPSFSSPDNRGCDVMTRSSSYSKKEHSDSMIPKRARSEGLLIGWIWQNTFHCNCLVITKSLKFCVIIISRDAAQRQLLAKYFPAGRELITGSHFTTK